MSKELKYWDGVPKDEIADAACAIDILDHCMWKIEPYLGGEMIFELGCGNGRLISALAKQYKGSFIGIDFSENMLSIAPKVKNITYVLNDGKSMPCGPDLFDSGYSMLVFQHVTEDVFSGYLKEVYRVLKPGGTFRFQFVHGTENVFLARNVNPQKVVDWVAYAGLQLIAMEQDEKFETWKWVTCQK